MIWLCLFGLFVVALLIVAYVSGRRQERADNVPRQGPTPDQARIEVESQKRVEQIETTAEEAKNVASTLRGEDLRKSFVNRMFRRK